MLLTLTDDSVGFNFTGGDSGEDTEGISPFVNSLFGRTASLALTADCNLETEETCGASIESRNDGRERPELFPRMVVRNEF